MTALGERIAHDWAVRSFGKDHVENIPVRSLRTVEESIELCQALGVSKELVHQCVDMVYGRPVGDPMQEAGGVLLTMAIMLRQLGLTIDEVLERELVRVLQKPPKHFAERNQQKLDLGMTVPLSPPGGDCDADYTSSQPPDTPENRMAEREADTAHASGYLASDRH